MPVPNPLFSANDHAFMARALMLAARGTNTTSPNPRVGCVLVKDAAVVGEGFHARAGQPHAETVALTHAGDAARGATAYVTLEPCSHHGRTPPCADALIQSGVTRVVAAMQDPNPLVAGQGIARLREAGLAVEVGLMATQAQELNIGFVSRMTRGRPWVRVKIAASLDGKTALENGRSQWITGPDARRDAHTWRARSCAILTGAGTVVADDPQLTVRDVPCERVPSRVVVDTRLETPPQARLFSAPGPVLLVCAKDHPTRGLPLRAAGAEVLACPGPDGHVDLAALMAMLAARGVNELLVEAGARLNGALLTAGLVDELLLYMAPTLLGNHARGLFEMPPLTDLAERQDVTITDVRSVGQDLRVVARIPPRTQT